MTGAGFLPCFGIFGSSMLPAFGEKISRSKELFLNQDAKYFVAVDGNDNGPGTGERPWATIYYAAQQAQAGDTVFVRGGHYVLTAQIRPRNSGRSDAWITFMRTQPTAGRGLWVPIFRPIRRGSATASSLMLEFLENFAS